jgi:hypothetical protein
MGELSLVEELLFMSLEEWFPLAEWLSNKTAGESLVEELFPLLDKAVGESLREL